MSFASTLTAIMDNLKLENSPTVTIQCKNGDVPVQKVLLTAASDVFRKMFDNDMLEKRTNIVVADDVDVYAITSIFFFYEDGILPEIIFQEDGKIPDMPPISLGAFNYVIDKYNFLGIKEAMAENLLDKFAKDNDLRVLEFIFTTFDCKAQRKIAINEIAMIIVKGRKGPDFIVDFDIHDFLQLSEIVCASLIKRKFEGWDSFLNCFYGWVSKNSEERSGTAVEILGMIDIREFFTSEVLKMLESLSLSKRFQGFKLMFEKTLDYVIKRNSTTCQYGQITCSICDFGFTPPYHTATGCNGVHRCRYWNTGDHIPSGNCGLPLMSDDAYIYTSLNYD